MTKKNIYRLNHASFETPVGTNMQKEIIKQMSFFRLPENICEKDAFNILSYLCLRIEEHEGAKINSYKNTARVNALLKEYGFDVLDKCDDICEEDVINLFSIEGNPSSAHPDKEIASSPVWFNKNITSEEVSDIYTFRRTKKTELVR